MSDKDINEIELISYGSVDGKELTIVLKVERKMTNEEVVLELEYLINEISRADDQLQQGARKH